MFDISTLKFDSRGLIPAVVTESGTGKVLTVAYMNAESLKVSMEKGLTCFWSRSRGELWLKGETSGNYQHIVSITADCDRDALLVEVVKDGPACHTGSDSCFGENVYTGEQPPAFTFSGLMDMLSDRRNNPKEGSYTSYLFDKGTDKILKKLGEETAEVIIAAKDNDRANTIYELSDLLYHAMVLMVQAGISVDDIRAEMASRHVIDRSRKK